MPAPAPPAGPGPGGDVALALPPFRGVEVAAATGVPAVGAEAGAPTVGAPDALPTGAVAGALAATGVGSGAVRAAGAVGFLDFCFRAIRWAA